MTTTTSGHAPRPLRADAARNRESLVAAAFTSFRRDGVNASLDDIAKAAGVGSGTLYRHFANRDALVLAVIEEQLAGLARSGAELADLATPIEAVERWMTEYIDQAGTFQGLSATLVSTVPDRGGSDSCHRARAAGAELIDRAIAAGQLRADTVPDDLLDLAAAIAWVGEHVEPDPARTGRLLRLCLAGARST
jgi:AcrR family transcriptional regulator